MADIGPNIVPDRISYSSSCNFIWNTRTIMSGLSLGYSPFKVTEVISGHLGLHVNVIKRSGGPYTWQIAIPS